MSYLLFLDETKKVDHEKRTTGGTMLHEDQDSGAGDWTLEWSLDTVLHIVSIGLSLICAICSIFILPWRLRVLRQRARDDCRDLRNDLIPIIYSSATRREETFKNEFDRISNDLRAIRYAATCFIYHGQYFELALFTGRQVSMLLADPLIL